jgi:hypothetical protein
VRGFVWVRIDARPGMRRLPDPNGPLEPWVVRGRTSTLGGHAVVDLTGRLTGDGVESLPQILDRTQPFHQHRAFELGGAMFCRWS